MRRSFGALAQEIETDDEQVGFTCASLSHTTRRRRAMVRIGAIRLRVRIRGRSSTAAGLRQLIPGRLQFRPDPFGIVRGQPGDRAGQREGAKEAAARPEHRHCQ